jgi:hypothetical protein
MRTPRLALAVAVVLLAALAPTATAAPTVLPPESFAVSISEARAQKCATRSVTGAGVDRRTFTAPGAGLGTITARLSGDDASDFDLAIVRASDDAALNGSAGFRSNEVTTTFVTGGEQYVVQTCRRKGASAQASLSVQFTTIPTADLRSAPEPIKLVKVALRTSFDLPKLRSLGLDTTDHPHPDHWDVLLYSADDERKLREAGLAFEVEQTDVLADNRADRAAERRAAASPTARAAARRATPGGRTTYRTLPEHEEDLKALVEAHPTLVRAVILPLRTWEGREISGIEIAENVSRQDDGRPVYVQVGTHHAREWPANEATIEFGLELVRNFVRDPDYLRNQPFDERRARIVREARTIVIPILNVDGFDMTIQSELFASGNFTDPVNSGGTSGSQNIGTGAYKRKNCRPVDPSATYVPCLARTIPISAANRDLGVDPNRNYGVEWGGPGTEGGPEPRANGLPTYTSLVYSGPAPFSEPETEGFRQYLRNLQPTVLITNHTFTGLILRPPGTGEDGPAPDEERLRRLGDAMAEETQYVSQYSYQLYDTTGTTDDYLYDGLGAFSYTPEIGKEEFHPAYAEFLAEYEGRQQVDIEGDETGRKLGGLREAFTLAGLTAIDRDSHSVIQGSAPAGRVLRIQKTIGYETSDRPNDNGFQFPVQQITEPRNSTTIVRADGTFEWHVNPSRQPRDPNPTAWQLTCEDRAGNVLERRQVFVERAQTVNVGLTCGAGSTPTVPAPVNQPPVGGGTPTQCVAPNGFRFVDVRQRGRGAVIRFGRTSRSRVDVDILQASSGRTVLQRQRTVRRYRGRTVSFTWNGRTAGGRTVTGGVYVVQFRTRDAQGRLDVRRVTIERARSGRFVSRGSTYLVDTCR